MSKDYKTGLIVGLAATVVALGWLVTRPSLSPEARMLRSARASAAEDPPPAGETPPVEPAPSRAEPVAQTETPSSPPPAPVNTDVLAQLLPESDTPPPDESVQGRTPPPDLTVYERDEKITTTRFHIVRKDETLSAISQQYYGSPNQWRKIVAANKDTIKDANKISPGVKLIIPD
ncbi:MAG: LysM peptidoglycan-binding domain-containing protein [Sedimentisphaerales bacterium]|nr:LysM peptidoglycan-binding domain-containing protein [Sedimentisphaerales bacterium]